VDDTWFTYETFAPLVGAEFRVRTPDGADTRLVLVDAQDTGRAGGQAADGRTRTQFSLVFRGSSSDELGQGVYPITSDRVTELPIFLVPIREDSDGRYYEAVFA
jgi:hypothetical protein